jgi:hypothetical protein
VISPAVALLCRQANLSVAKKIEKLSIAWQQLGQSGHLERSEPVDRFDLGRIGYRDGIGLNLAQPPG